MSTFCRIRSLSFRFVLFNFILSNEFSFEKLSEPKNLKKRQIGQENGIVVFINNIDKKYMKSLS